MSINDLVVFFAAMSPADLVNGIFESCGGFFIALSILKLHREKVVKGVSWPHVAFFSSWGLWNLYFYPHLDQWMSFWGGLLLVISNCIWLGQIVYWNLHNRRASPFASGGFVSPAGDQVMHLIKSAEFSLDGGVTWVPGDFNDAFRAVTSKMKTPRYRHCDK